MTKQFQYDTWVLDIYLDEAGWDGQHEQVYFSTQRDALAVGEALEKRVEAHNDDHRLDWEVYKLFRYPSFHNQSFALEGVIQTIGDGMLADIEQEEADA